MDLATLTEDQLLKELHEAETQSEALEDLLDRPGDDGSYNRPLEPEDGEYAAELESWNAYYNRLCSELDRRGLS